MNKKLLYTGLTILTLIIVIITGYSLFGRSQNKGMLLIIDKIYIAYGKFIKDNGTSPTGINEFYENTSNSSTWAGPYISKKIVDEYKNGKMDIIKASLIPTKKCSFESTMNCYTWILADNVSQAVFEQTKKMMPNSGNLFYADNKLYFKVTLAE
ncbi:MAG: hypothetical protein GY793_12090 [Proteobacteria bacterium]|nr:hypothetical protein [Pseudomonadota bacterium]